MNRESMHTGRLFAPLALAALMVALAVPAAGQVPVDEDGNPIGTLDPGARVENPTQDDGTLLAPAQLEELVGPVALYPDDLLAIVLPASTYPLEIVQAARFLDEVESDPSLKPDPEWDDSIVALLNYPEVLRMMNDDIDWTWRLGEAVVAQQADVISAVESFRNQAYAAGNLKSDEHQTVSVTDDIIEIDPVDDDVIYVPYYEPERVVVYSPQPVYYYYPRAYPLYYYPYPAGHYFTLGYFWGVTTAFQIGWWDDFVHVHHYSYRSHPYYGHYYYGTYWRQPTLYIHNSYYVNNHVHGSYDRHRHGDYWRPRHRSGARPVHSVARDTYYSDRRRPRASSRDGYYTDNGTRRPHSVADTSSIRESLARSRTATRAESRTAASRNVRTSGATAGARATPASRTNTGRRDVRPAQVTERRPDRDTRRVVSDRGRTRTAAVSGTRRNDTASRERNIRPAAVDTASRERTRTRAVTQRRETSAPRSATPPTARSAPRRLETRRATPATAVGSRFTSSSRQTGAVRSQVSSPRASRAEAPRSRPSSFSAPSQRSSASRPAERQSAPPREQPARRDASGGGDRRSSRGARESRSRSTRDRH